MELRRVQTDGVVSFRKSADDLKAPTFLSLRDISISLCGRQILSPISLEAGRGRFVCIVGPSGCGKTTLLRAVAGLAKVGSGSVEVAGKPMVKPSLDVAFVFQDYGRALLPWRTVEGNISLALEATGISKAQRKERIEETLQKVGLTSHARKFPPQLSGGMQQRVQIARCLAQRPKLLLMDEPFGALDAMTRQSLQDEVARLVNEEGITVLFVTHDLEEAIYLGDRVIVLRANPTPGRPSLAKVVDVDIPRPRDQLTTREHPRFLELRHDLFIAIEHGNA